MVGHDDFLAVKCIPEGPCLESPTATMTDSSSDYLIEAGISPEVIALVPEPIARENVLLPFSATNNAVKVLFAERPDFDLLQKLNYILNRDIYPALARRVAILAAIDHYYGSSSHRG